MRKHLLAAAGVSAVLALSLTACGTGSNQKSGSGKSASPSASAGPRNVNFGPGCAAVPKDASNAGSFQAMAAVPVATAASGNPLLTTLVSLVKKENLVDTLNGAPGLTVFAPTNDAFKKIPAATLNSLTDAQIKTILTYHVIGQRLAPDQLAGNHRSLQGGDVVVGGSGTSFTARGPGNPSPANVVCGNVQTANANVYLVDTVLMPAM